MAKRKRAVSESLEEQLATEPTDEQVGVRMDSALYRSVCDYADKADSESVAAAVRELVSIGLTETGMMEDGVNRTIKENARRGAIRRMATVMQQALEVFRDQEIEFEEEIGEE